MVDKSIIFSAPMVRALIEGRKTQTRRILRPQPAGDITGCGRFADSRVGLKDDWEWLTGDQTDIDSVSAAGSFKTRYLEGDRLWVREAWRAPKTQDERRPADMPARTMSIRFEAGGWISNVSFKGDWRPTNESFVNDPPSWIGKLRSSLHLPRWASRITLVVTDVRVQRLQDIGEDDARAEGVNIERYVPVSDSAGMHASGEAEPTDPVEEYRDLWDSLHGPDAWSKNPWIAAISFRPILANIDAPEAQAV